MVMTNAMDIFNISGICNIIYQVNFHIYIKSIFVLNPC